MRHGPGGKNATMSRPSAADSFSRRAHRDMMDPSARTGSCTTPNAAKLGKTIGCPGTHRPGPIHRQTLRRIHARIRHERKRKRARSVLMSDMRVRGMEVHPAVVVVVVVRVPREPGRGVRVIQLRMMGRRLPPFLGLLLLLLMILLPLFRQHLFLPAAFPLRGFRPRRRVLLELFLVSVHLASFVP